MSFPCPSCGHDVDAEPEEDWVCAGCGEIHHAKAAAPAMAAVGAPGLDFARPERAVQETPPAPAVGERMLVGPESATLPPVPVRVHGRPRKFWTGFLLGIVTLGIYYAYWQLRAFGEVDRQEQAPRWAWLWWVWCAFVLVSIAFILQMGTQPGEVPAHMLWTFPASHALFIAYIGLEARNLARAGNARGLAMPPVGLVVGLLALASLLQVAPTLMDWPQAALYFGIPFDMLAFAFLQDGINKLWKAVYAEAGSPSPPPPMSTW